MTSRHSMRRGVGPGLVKRQDRRNDRIPDRESKALLGAEVDFVRTAGPRALAEHFAMLEARGEILSLIDPPQEEREQSADLEVGEGIESYPEDEDIELIEVWSAPGNQTMNAVVLGECDVSTESLADKDSFELVVDDGACAFHTLEWAWQYKPVSQRAEKQLNELAARCGVFRELATWLNSNRADFLKLRDFWHLGPASLEEVERHCSVLQQEMPAVLGIDSLTEETFSRYVKRCEITWSDGSAPLQILFSKQARLAWVARSVVHFVGRSPKPLRDRLDKLRGVSWRRDNAGNEANLIRGKMTFEEFIRLAIKRTGTSWQEVLNNYETRMLTENEHAKKE